MRQHPRYNVDLRADAVTKDAFLSSRVSNISRGGLFLESEHLPSDSEVMLTLELGETGSAVLAVGQVAWSCDVRKESIKTMSGSGIRFMWMSAGHRTRLRGFLDELEQRSVSPGPRGDGPHGSSSGAAPT
jgi:Tfp pilus assembly protein PilZ